MKVYIRAKAAKYTSRRRFMTRRNKHYQCEDCLPTPPGLQPHNSLAVRYVPFTGIIINKIYHRHFYKLRTLASGDQVGFVDEFPTLC